ncbi:hypothetical protein [Spiroplasma endosymbiont of Lonchoptera lutea]
MAFRKKVKNTKAHRRYLSTTAKTVRAANLFRSTSRGGIRF